MKNSSVIALLSILLVIKNSTTGTCLIRLDIRLISVYLYDKEKERKGALIYMTTYNTRGTCATEIDFDLTDGIVKNVKFKGGCQGNLQAISTLLEGMPAEEVIKKLKGITCGTKSTSCTDQLAIALQEQLQK